MGRIALAKCTVAVVVTLVAGGTGACSPSDAPVADAGATKTTTPPVAHSRFVPVNSADPVGELSALLGGRRGFCVQFRAVPEKADALAIASRIESETKIPVALIEAEIKGRGTWYRLCAGAEASVAAATQKAGGWTSTGGALAPFMEPTAPGQARYFVKERPVPSTRQPTEAQARLVLAARPDAERNVVTADLAPTATTVAGANTGGLFLAAVTTPKDASGAWDILVVDPQGRQVPFAKEGAPGCPACAAALTSSPAVGRRILGAGDVFPNAGEEIFVEEQTARKSRILIVFRQSLDANGRLFLKRAAAYWLGTEQKGLRLLTRVQTVEADGDPERELALILTEMPMYKGRLCALRTRAEIHDLSPRVPRVLDEKYAMAMAAAEDGAQGGTAVRKLVSSLDRLGDHRSGSRVCAAYLSRGRDVQLTQHCIGRLRQLNKSGRNIEAVNAAGMLAESAESLRAVVAGPFYDVVKTLDRDVRLTIADENCLDSPLVDGVDRRPLSQTLRMAQVAKKERVNLAAISDAVFVTGARDFGPKTPVGRVTAKWLERLRISLPARFAAIEALLAEAPSGAAPAPHENPVPTEAPRELRRERVPTEKELGRPRIILKVHDEDPGEGSGDGRGGR